MMHVLLIEPDKILGSAYKKGLDATGLRVGWTDNAQGAIHAIDSKTPDLIILEPKMPEHSGIEFLHEFRSYEDWFGVPVIIYSSVPEYSFGVEPTIWQKFGVTRYLEKSKVSIAQLAAIVKSYNKNENAS